MKECAHDDRFIYITSNSKNSGKEKQTISIEFSSDAIRCGKKRNLKKKSRDREKNK